MNSDIIHGLNAMEIESSSSIHDVDIVSHDISSNTESEYIESENIESESIESKLSENTESKSSIRYIESEVTESSEYIASTNKRKREQTKWLDEVNYYQRTTDLLIPYLPFKRFVKEIIEDFKSDTKITEEGIKALQTASEDYIINFLNCTQDLAIHRGSDTITQADIKMLKYIKSKL